MRACLPANPAAILALPPCTVAVFTHESWVTRLEFTAPDTPLIAPTTPLTIQVADALSAYLENPDCVLALPLAALGTPFQQRVWRTIAAIPRGQVRQYGAIAAELGSAARAVGQACGANPFPVLVPCHRVVAAQGLGGFAGHRSGWLTATKRWLLAHEGAVLP